MKVLRCAVYTRKSTEDGLEQEFNSLDAQREACEAYVLSQRHEGWTLVPNRYDDGGFSGGTMERPGIKALMADIDAGLVDVIVVYKVDRLTRSLADFAKIVERLDAKEASFVSVTQAFNTTTSMGRLTLNVLLSFAQFEREVKRKGPADYAPDNVDEHGDYVVGKNRPPENGKFRAGDGRPRGTRQKGVRNLATDLREELETWVTVSVGGKQVRVSRQRAILMRLGDNASRGQNRAIALTLDYQQRIVEPILAEELLNAQKYQELDFSVLDNTEFNAYVYLASKIHKRPFKGEPPTIIDNPPGYSARVRRDDADEAG